MLIVHWLNDYQGIADPVDIGVNYEQNISKPILLQHMMSSINIQLIICREPRFIFIYIVYGEAILRNGSFLTYNLLFLLHIQAKEG